MVNRLEPINLTSFTGGLNLRRSQFQLADDESPDMLNVDIDPRGGFYTRRGWQRWSYDEIVDLHTTAWRPCNSFVANHSDGSRDIYMANENVIYYCEEDRIFHELQGVMAMAEPHCVDFAAWGDDVYMALGKFEQPVRVTPLHAITRMTQVFSEVEAPVSNTMPMCETAEVHSGYLFCAVTTESGITYHNRLRFSHPLKPDSWRADDYIDIEAGGGRITNLMSFSDHLLIFKTNSMWALYGYDSTSWQLVKVSTMIGVPGPSACTRSENAAYFFSASGRCGIYGYNGQQPAYLSEALRPAFEQMTEFDFIFVSWAGRRLWVSVPWVMNVGATEDIATVFVMDPDVGQGGAWMQYRSDYGCPGPVVDGSDITTRSPLSGFWSNVTASVISLDAIESGYDLLDHNTGIAVTAGGAEIGELGTSLGDMVAVTVGIGGRPFDAYYKTRWLHAGWPDRKKSWRRPTFVCRQVQRDTDLLIETYRDYNETQVQRTRTLHLRARGSAYWTEGGYEDHEMGGFDWTEGGADDTSGRGANWGQTQDGATLERAGSQGMARAVQMRVRLSPTTPERRWGVDGIVCKIVMRRFR